MKFSESYASSSNSFPEFDKDQKKGLYRTLKGFCPLNRVKPTKKGFHRSLELHSAGIRDLFVLTATF